MVVLDVEGETSSAESEVRVAVVRGTVLEEGREMKVGRWGRLERVRGAGEGVCSDTDTWSSGKIDEGGGAGGGRDNCESPVEKVVGTGGGREDVV